MLNTSYRLIKRKRIPILNANRNAWFVNDVKLVNKSNTEMKMLDKLNTKKAAIFNIHLYGDKFKCCRLKEI
jgi:hypothetical protein